MIDISSAKSVPPTGARTQTHVVSANSLILVPVTNPFYSTVNYEMTLSFFVIDVTNAMDNLEFAIKSSRLQS